MWGCGKTLTRSQERLWYNYVSMYMPNSDIYSRTRWSTKEMRMFEYIWADAAAKMYVYRHIKNLGCAQKYCLLGWMVFHNRFELSLQGHNIHTCFVSLFLYFSWNMVQRKQFI